MIANKKMKEKQYTRFGGTCLKCHGQSGLQFVGSQRVGHDWMSTHARLNAQVHLESWFSPPVLRSQPGHGLNTALEQADWRQEPLGLCAGWSPLRFWPLRTMSVASQPFTVNPLPIPREEWYQTEAPEASKNQVGPPILIPFADKIWPRFAEKSKNSNHCWILFRIKHLCSEPMKTLEPKHPIFLVYRWQNWGPQRERICPKSHRLRQVHRTPTLRTGPWPSRELFLLTIHGTGQEGGLGPAVLICLVAGEHPGSSSYLAGALPPLLSLPTFKMGSLSRSIRPSNQHLWSIYCMLDMVPGSGEEKVN